MAIPLTGCAFRILAIARECSSMGLPPVGAGGQLLSRDGTEHSVYLQPFWGHHSGSAGSAGTAVGRAISARYATATLDAAWTIGSRLDTEPLISLKEAAARFGLSHSHLRLLARSGRLRATRMGRDWFTTAAAVTAYLQDPALRRKGPRPRDRPGNSNR